MYLLVLNGLIHQLKHIRGKLESEFTGSLHFIANEKGKVLVYPDSLSLGLLVTQFHQVEQDVSAERASTDSSVSREAALELQQH